MPKIVRVGILNSNNLSIALSNKNMILPDLQPFLHKPEYVPFIEDERIRFPKTDGKRVYWRDGPSITIKEVTEKILNIQQPKEVTKYMELWLAVLLFIIVTVGAALMFYSHKKRNKRWLIVGICVLGAVLLILAAYIALTYLFLDSFSSEAPPPDSLECLLV